MEAEKKPQQRELARSLTFIDILCLGINSIVGSGIFLFPGRIAKEAGPASILAFLACGLLLVTVALCYAEMSSIYRRNGGSYVYAREAFGPVIGYGVGWISWITAIFSWAAVANAISAYMTQFHPAFSTPELAKAVACGLILFFGFINYFGIKLGAITVNLFTFFKLMPLFIFGLVGLFFVSSGNFAAPVPNPTHAGPLMGINMATFGTIVFMALWPLQGFENTPVAAGETKHPHRDIPKAAIGSLLFAALFYTLIQFVAVGVLPGLAHSPKPLADAAAVFLGPAGALLLAVGAVVSMTGYSAGNALGSPRFLEALSHDRCLPQALATPHARYHTPSRAIALTTALTALVALSGDFQRLVDISNLAVIAQYLSTCLAVLWLRYRQPGLERPFKVPLGPVIPLAGSLVSLWLIRQVKTPEVIIAACTLVIGFICWGAYQFYLKRSISIQEEAA